MRSMRGWIGLCAALVGAGCVETGGGAEGCEADSDCGDGLVCASGRCEIPGGAGGGGAGSGSGGEGGGGGAGEGCTNDEACGSGICQTDGICCPQSCSDAACGELRCGRRCHAACRFEFLGGGANDACGPEGWPSGRSATPFAALGGGRFLLFSGDDPPTVAPADLWELTLQAAPEGGAVGTFALLPSAPASPAPEARYGHVLVALPVGLCRAHGAPDECVLLWGGRTRGVSPPGLTGSWLWARSTGFVALELPIEPSARLYPAVAVDGAGERLVFFGGWGCSGACNPYIALDDTWVFDAAGWRELDVRVRPNARGRSVLTGPLPDGRFVLVGGRGVGAPAATFKALWSFDGNAWSAEAHLAPLTTVRHLHAAFWAPGAEGIVVHGGKDVTASGGEGLPMGDTELLSSEVGANVVTLGAVVAEPPAYRAWAWDPAWGLVVFGGEEGSNMHCELHRLLIR